MVKTVAKKKQGNSGVWCFYMVSFLLDWTHLLRRWRLTWLTVWWN